jgi:hypothetical protein
MPSSPVKIALFIDGANLYATTKTLGFEIDYKFGTSVPPPGTNILVTGSFAPNSGPSTRKYAASRRPRRKTSSEVASLNVRTGASGARARYFRLTLG